jgi:diguanylate cyclase (GGDEF)-like protein
MVCYDFAANDTLNTGKGKSMAIHRIPIFSRFTLYCTLFVAVVAGLAASTIVSMVSADQNTTELEHKWLNGAAILGQIDFGISAYHITETYRALAPDAAGRAAAEASANRESLQIDDLETQYAALFRSDVSASGLTKFDAIWRSYQAAHADWLDGNPPDIPDQRTYPGSNLDRQYHAADDAIDALIDQQRKNARLQAQTILRISHRMIVIACVIVAGAVALALALLLLVLRNIVRPLRNITATMTRLASGEHEIAVPERHRLDEIGKMAAACEVFRINVLALEKAHQAASAAEALAHRLARHDALTGLPNRRVFSADLEAALGFAQKGIATYSVFLLDLDEFKKINDLQGHQTGDTVLCEIARRLESVVRKSDTVARLGGDEFAIIAKGESTLHDHLESAKRLAGRLLAAIRQPILVGGSPIEIAASIGIVTCRAEASDVNYLLRAADIAMYRAKQSGKLAFRFFEQSMDDEMRDQEALERDLVSAVAAGEILPYYQPLIDMTHHRICGFEALARWNHPERGFVPPDIFIPMIEQLGLMTTFTATILRQACRDARQWPEQVRVAVNFSAGELKDPELANRIVTILNEEGLAPSRLEVEITETALVSDIHGAKTILAALQRHGITICMDDFGTGYSSLYHLHELKFDKVKIDRSFVQAMQNNNESEKIIDAILGLTNSLNLPTVAEGIENSIVLRQLMEKGCGIGQGYYFGLAMTGTHARELLLTGPQSLDFGQPAAVAEACNSPC